MAVKDDEIARLERMLESAENVRDANLELAISATRDRDAWKKRGAEFEKYAHAEHQRFVRALDLLRQQVTPEEWQRLRINLRNPDPDGWDRYDDADIWPQPPPAPGRW